MKRQNEKKGIWNEVDKLVDILNSSSQEFDPILSIDHSRLAIETGVYTPPSIVTLFSNPKVNSELIRLNPLVGLDLPYKVLCYSEADTINSAIAYTSSAFLQKRHGLKNNDLQEFENDLKKVLSNFSESQIVKTDVEEIEINYGIIQLKSDYDFETTIKHLKKVVKAQSDTKWFGEINFQKDAKEVNIDVVNSTLLLFGAPAPGGKEMFNSPKLGLDAFCQKLLVYSNEQNEVVVAFNDISALSRLYYNRATKPQKIIDGRLKSVFETALINNK